MNKRLAILAAAFSAAAVLAAPAAAIQNADDMVTGERFRKNVSIDTETRLPDGGLLVKGSPTEVEVESLGKGRVKATFFQGGVRKGEANGIIIIGGAPARARFRPGASGDPHQPLRFSDLGLGASSPAAWSPIGDKVDLNIGTPGGNQIRIGLQLPAVAPRQKVGLTDPPDPDKQPRRADTQGERR